MTEILTIIWNTLDMDSVMVRYRIFPSEYYILKVKNQKSPTIYITTQAQASHPLLQEYQATS